MKRRISTGQRDEITSTVALYSTTKSPITTPMQERLPPRCRSRELPADRATVVVLVPDGV